MIQKHVTPNQLNITFNLIDCGQCLCQWGQLALHVCQLLKRRPRQWKTCIVLNIIKSVFCTYNILSNESPNASLTFFDMLKTNDTNHPSFACCTFPCSSLRRDELLDKEVIQPAKRSRIKRYKNARKMKINYAVCILLNL